MIKTELEISKKFAEIRLELAKTLVAIDTGDDHDAKISIEDVQYYLTQLEQLCDKEMNEK